MASEQEVRNQANQQGLNNAQTEQAVQFVKSDPNISVDEAINKARNK